MRHPITRSTSLAIAALALHACGGSADKAPGAPQAGGSTNKAAAGNGMPTLQAIAKERNLSPDDLVAAAKTYMPSGRLDDYIMFSSGGHSGQVLVIGVPSMRLLKVIGVFTPEPWQGYGYGTGEEVLAGGQVDGRDVLWGDTHHPGLSETGGDYDGQFLFINDKANARIAVIDLRDFDTKQIVKNPLSLSDHGGAFVTPDTEWIIEGGQYAQPLGWGYAPIEEYKAKYRGMVTFWKFDRAKGRIDMSKSFAMELPPYWQDLFDAGKKVSNGWVFCNSLNGEMATGGIESGNPPFEAGVSAGDNDYLHAINLKKAAELAAAGRTTSIKGFPVVELATSIAEGLLYFLPAPKSPHGVDVSPDGNYIVVSGKLDPHVSIYAFDKIQATIAAKKHKPDAFGVPILDFDSCVTARVELGLGPLHTQFDDMGYAYTSLFLEPAVARWTLGGEAGKKNTEPDWTLVGKINTHYNIGHISIAEGDTVSPDGMYLIAMNKWSLDRFANVGPLMPQNFQLIDISRPGDSMQLLYDMPIGIGEPHYGQTIKADKLKPWTIYPEIGWDPHTQQVDPKAPIAGQERVVRNGNVTEVYMTAVRSHFTPEHVNAKAGDTIIWHITSLERADDATHGFSVPAYDINLSLEPGEYARIKIENVQAGTYPFYCSEFCSALHLEMMGYLLVAPQ